MLNIDWHIEALNFCKKNNICPQQTTLASIELSMRHGALLMVDKFAHVIKLGNDELAKKRKASMPQHDTKIIKL